MKKIFYIALFILALVELQSHGACLIEQMKLQKSCTGAAAPIQNKSSIDKQKSDKFSNRPIEKSDKSNLKLQNDKSSERIRPDFQQSR